jgi:hypothetical protein
MKHLSPQCNYLFALVLYLLLVYGGMAGGEPYGRMPQYAFIQFSLEQNGIFFNLLSLCRLRDHWRFSPRIIEI